MRKARIGIIDGGRTFQSESDEIESCDIEIELKDNTKDYHNKLLNVLNRFEFPKGSCLFFDDDKKLEMGEMEGLALYINGIDLDEEVYKDFNINFVVSELERYLEKEGKLYNRIMLSTEGRYYHCT